MQYTNGFVKTLALCSMCIAAATMMGCATKATSLVVNSNASLNSNALLNSSTSPNSSAPLGPSTGQFIGDFSRSKLIASDFVAIMTQLPESQPSDTVLYIDKPATRFGELLLSALQNAGFELRIGDSQSPLWLAYSATRDESLSVAGNPIFTFHISTGSIKLKRSYEVGQFGVRPVGNMFVQGATTGSVVIDDSIFSVRMPLTAGVFE